MSSLRQLGVMRRFRMARVRYWLVVGLYIVGTAIGYQQFKPPQASAADGITWTARTSAADNNWFNVTYGNGLFVAVATSGTGNRVMTSPDGINWTIRTSAADNDWRGVTYGNGLFVAVAGSGTGNRVMTSPDGINWTIRTSAADNLWLDVVYGNGLFVAVSYTGSGDRVMTSPDGINWTSRTSAADNQWDSVTYGNGVFVAVANSGTGNRVMTSPDGINWTIRTSAADNGWLDLVYGNGTFVAVANTGTGNRVMTSPDGPHMMLFWDGASPPSGWSFVADGDGRHIRGESVANYGARGGSSTHTHTASASVGGSSSNLASGILDSVASSGHTHNTSVTVASASNDRAARTLKLIRYDAGIPNVIPAGAITIFDSSPGIPASGWTRQSAFDGRFVKLDSTAASANSGSDTHSHNLTWGSLSGSSGGSNSNCPWPYIGCAGFMSSNGHTHGAPGGTNTSTNGTSAADCDAAPVANSCLPPHVQVLLAKADADTPVLSIGITAMFDDAPGGGWVVRSDSGGAYYQRFMRGGASYSEGLGASTHNHISQTVTSPGNSGSGGRSYGGGGAARDGHTHTVTASSFSSPDHTPEYFNVVVAEKVNFILQHYAWYDDNDALAVTSRYSPSDVGEDTPIPVTFGYQPPGLGQELRLRIQVAVNNSALANDEIQFKLQYIEDTSTSLTTTTCTTGTWTDVANNGGGGDWTYATSTPSNGAQLTGSSVFSPASSTMQRYVKSDSAGKNIGTVSSGQTMEWDYHIVSNTSKTSTQYRFRLVEDSGILLSQYGYGSPTVTPVCPTLTTKAEIGGQLRHGQVFDNTGTKRGFTWD
jgi:hypothetical protein